LSDKHIDSNYLEDSKKLSKIEKIEKYKPKVEDKKSSLKKLKTSMKEQKLNTLVQNNNNVLKKMQVQPSTDDSTNDEIDVIKQINEKKTKIK